MIAPGDIGRINTRMMTVALGYEMQSRGTDATGIYTCDAKGRWKVRKQANKADVFLAYRNGIGANATSLMLHTRAATQGKANISGNNHPINYGRIIGIHNGIVWNDDKLFAHYEWERLAQVDSEAIFAALNNLPQREALENIDGSWAIAWTDTDDDPRKLWLCRGDGSPLHYAMTADGSVVFASTPTAVKEAFEYGGIKGVPTTIEAKEGFLAYINPDGGLEIQESPDTSGKSAVGVRAWKHNQGTYGSHQGWAGHNANAGFGGSLSQEDAEYDAMWRNHQDRIKSQSKDDPTPGQRIMVKGDAQNPKVDDVRKYIDAKGDWHFEKCIQVFAGGGTSWKMVYEWENKPEIRAEYLKPKEVVLPFGDEAEDFMLGYAEVGDFVTFDKGMIDGGNGHFGGYVRGVTNTQILVEFRPAWLDLGAAYMIAMTNRKEEIEVST